MQRKIPNIKIVKRDVEGALAEDVGTGDITARLIPDNLLCLAVIISREPMLVCGQDWVNEVFRVIDSKTQVKWLVSEGDWLDKAQTICEIHGLTRSILTAERTALNFLQTLSATATQTYTYQKKLAGYNTRLLDTRKTIPGLRNAQKYAVSCGGGVNHRIGLYDAYLIKENHIKACGSIALAIKFAKDSGLNKLIEVEVETIKELEEALNAKPDRIMLDNFSIEMINEAMSMSKNSACLLEASGGINLSTIEDVAKTGVHFVSVGSITKSIKAIDLSLLVKEKISS